MKTRTFLTVFAAVAAVLQVGGAGIRPSSVPIVSCNPFFSVWSPSTRPNETDTTIWYGERQPIRVEIEMDGTRYRLMGARGDLGKVERQADTAMIKCTDCRVRPLTTVFTYSDGRRTVELLFFTPKIADDLDVFSRPVTYATVKTTGAKSVKVFAEVGYELATNDDRAEMTTNRLTVAGLSAVSIGRKDQKPLSKSGDQVRCDWGYVTVVNPVAEGADVHFLLAYDDVETLQFLGQTLPAWWRRGGKSFVKMLEEAEADYPRLLQETAAFDARWERELEAVGGAKYRELASLAYRQSFAACELVAGPDGQPLYFSKENSSNGCIGTVDVFYPQMPLLLLASKTLVRATLEPILLYATSGQWPFAYAPHDVGRWPLANGQVYNFGPGYRDKQGNPKPDSKRMPVEECGNMLISLCALTEAEGDAAFVGRYWDTVSAWARYLEQFGFDPGDQLCTDDFAGHLAHNANLSIKTIMAFAATARMAERLGKADAAKKYRTLAEEAVPKWIAAAEGGAAGGFRLAFDQPGSWSLKYNLVWDRVLGFGLFPPEVATRELSAYRQLALPFGIALDCRKPYTKVDWEFWSAALTGRREDLDFVTDLVWRYVDETSDRLPFPDWGWANNGRVRGFWGRSVIGGVFMPVLADRAVRERPRPLVVGIADICRTNNLVEVGSPYAEAVYAAGAVPYLLPSTTNAAVIAALVDRIDMLLLAGGEDVAPARYGATPHALTKVNDRRDVWEFALLDEVVRRRLPVLGVCRGCQLLNVAFGGTLWQDLPSEKEGARVHRLAGEHPIAVAEGAFLAKLTDGLSSSVNSQHHQAVRKPAPGFRIAATSPDGVTEAIEGSDYPAMGVQFHPEKLFAYTGRKEFLPLFRGAFADAKPVEPRPIGRMKLVAIPDYCPTNGCVVAKPNMTAALEMAGFASVVIPFTADDEALAAALADADALMVAGGIGALQDYGKRCAFEHRAIRLALARGIPIAGVCHGSQVINTYFGGTLELTPQKKGEEDFLIAHRMPVRTPYTDNFHLADLTPGSRIAGALGSTRAVINSSHGNRSFKMGEGLVVTARAQDGVVEAFEHATLPVMAFQFHPERLAFDRRFIELLRVSLEGRSLSTEPR